MFFCRNLLYQHAVHASDASTLNGSDTAEICYALCLVTALHQLVIEMWLCYVSQPDAICIDKLLNQSQFEYRFFSRICLTYNSDRPICPPFPNPLHFSPAIAVGAGWLILWQKGQRCQQVEFMWEKRMS